MPSCSRYVLSLVDGLCLPSKDSTGGIWVLWDTSKVEILNSCVKDFSVSVYDRLRNSEVGWMVTGVYGPCSSERKPAFFQELYDPRSLWNGPSCLCGNFNEVLCSKNRSTGSMPGGMNLFADLVNSLVLRDVPISSAQFTWSSMQRTPSLTKLDRFLLSSKWDFSFPFSKGLVRPKPISDHIPIVLCGNMPEGTLNLSNLKICG